ncbi:thermonuclease family protein [Ochrobactrum sp. 3-3]|uniref:thermonuclease family protein n=1 Tax=Ochrobactrum sp. 3-3 TaxID=1830124 RepID=UPI0025711AF3|nr:thermonuclease family protein [Ochrobactrum sp. 3-3]
MILLTVSGSAAAETGTWSGRARVIDGDTISIGRQRIRIAAIDSCELKQTGIQSGKVWPCGLVARSYLRRMVDGKHVRCEIIDRDQYRRLVGQCFIADTDIGLAMVNAGLAEAMLRYLPRSHSISLVEYGEAENRARDRGLGIWSAEIESPHLYRRGKSSSKP